MKVRLSVLAFVVALMMPALAVAQSSAIFFSFVDYEGVDDTEDYVLVESTVSCNAGIPLEQTASVGGVDDGVLFTVTELFDEPTCTVSYGDIPAGWQVSGVYAGYWQTTYSFYPGEEACVFGPEGMYPTAASHMYENFCVLELIPEPVDFEVTVDWQISPDADVGVGMYAYAVLECYNLLYTGYSATTLDAGPDADMPLVLTGLYPEPDGGSYCYAGLFGTGSAVDTDMECWFESVDLDVGSNSSCTITATAFYEGVPTLSQYGMAIMALLMLGMGFVGFRRFA